MVFSIIFIMNRIINLYPLLAAIFLIVIINNPLDAQHLEIEKVQGYFDSTATPEIFNRVPIGFVITYSDGSQKKTSGLLSGNLKWRKLKIHSDQGKIKKGMLIYDRKLVWNNNHRVTFGIKYQDTMVVCNLKLPYPESIRFNLYTDSIKKKVPFYLNVEGTFSNGKIYPLDTNMIHITASSGNVEGNTLQLSQKDTISTIKTVVSLKWDKTLEDSVIIPVKTHLKEVTLPSEDELFNKWGKSRRKR